MKRNSILFTVLVSTFFLFGCEKSDNTTNTTNVRVAATPANFKIKQIIGPMDTVILLTNNDSVISQPTENFFYDNADKLIKKTKSTTTKIGINGIIAFDTLETINYTYNSTSNIANYTQTKNGFTFNHIIDYDSQNRFIRDSVINSTSTQATTITCSYLQDTVIKRNRNDIETVTDTLIYNNNILVKHTINYRNPNGWVSRFIYSYTSNTSTNPLSLLGNFNLYATEYTTGNRGIGMFDLRDTYIMVKNTTTQINRNGVVFFNNNVYDNLGRIIEMRDSYNGNKITKYIYY